MNGRFWIRSIVGKLYHVGSGFVFTILEWPCAVCHVRLLIVVCISASQSPVVTLIAYKVATFRFTPHLVSQRNLPTSYVSFESIHPRISKSRLYASNISVRISSVTSHYQV